MGELEQLLKLVVDIGPEAKGAVWAVAGAWAAVHVLGGIASTAGTALFAYFLFCKACPAGFEMCRKIWAKPDHGDAMKRLYEEFGDQSIEKLDALNQALKMRMRKQLIDDLRDSGYSWDRDKAAKLAEKWFAPEAES